MNDTDAIFIIGGVVCAGALVIGFCVGHSCSAWRRARRNRRLRRRINRKFL